MSYSLTIELPDELRQRLFQVASAAKQTPQEWLVASLRRQLIVRDDRLRRHFGAVNLGTPTGVDNTQIDIDLARAYADTHQEP
jgi:hypothetical protein